MIYARRGLLLVAGLLAALVWFQGAESPRNAPANRTSPGTAANTSRKPTAPHGTPAAGSAAKSAAAGSPSEQPASDSVRSKSAAKGRSGDPKTATGTEQRSDNGSPPPSQSLVQRGVTIRNLDGKVVFRGDVDLEPTLRRIEQGQRLSHRNDGSVFQNRERRLPQQPRGYYREYVHPTADLSGPGPQRVVLGEEGEVYYTPDHYRTFRRIR